MPASSLDGAGNMYVTDGSNNRLREVVSATPATITPDPSQASALYPAPGEITITQPGGARVTFYAQSGGQCASAPYSDPNPGRGTRGRPKFASRVAIEPTVWRAAHFR